MILSNNDFASDTCMVTDLCIIGSGPAGLTIAKELKESIPNIIVLTGGLSRETHANQDLQKGIVLPPNSHEPLHENRRRAFGGTSLAWGGRCIPFDPIDFKKRDWIPHSGWPFSYEEIVPYYKRAMEILKAGDFQFDVDIASFGSKKSEIIEGIDGEDIISSKLERWSTPVNFAVDYFGEFKNSSTIKILLDTHLVSINTEHSKDVVSSVDARAGEKRFTIKATNYILACGGIENPRLLLSSRNKFYQNGIGNDHDVVGRYYMAHVNGTFASVSPSDRKNIVFKFERDQIGVYCRRRWWITEKAQVNNNIANIIFFLDTNSNKDGHRDVVFSLILMSKFLLLTLKRKSITKARQELDLDKSASKGHFNVILREGWKLVPRLGGWAVRRFRTRNIPFVLPSVKSKSLGLYFQSEQTPHPDSRITISKSEFDALGVPRAVVNIAFHEIDKKTIEVAHKIFMESYTQRVKGKVDFNPNDLSRFIDQRIENFNSAAHHLGTTRISNDPQYGVVDENCKVHGIDNLFIAGSSVFPTGGHANPTLTIVALAVKLAHFIANKKRS